MASIAVREDGIIASDDRPERDDGEEFVLELHRPRVAEMSAD